MRPTYIVRFCETVPRLDADADAPDWRGADVAVVRHFRPEGSGHEPRVNVRLLYDYEGLYVRFDVEDRFVRVIHTEYGEAVCEDSCVEWFAQPHGKGPYFNLEFNAGGTMLAMCIRDPERTPQGFKDADLLDEVTRAGVRCRHSLPDVVEPEIDEPLTWSLACFVPFALFETHVGPIGDPAGQTWRGNFYKCGDKTSHPHWGAWAPVPEVNFHLPACFGNLRFACDSR